MKQRINPTVSIKSSILITIKNQVKCMGQAPQVLTVSYGKLNGVNKGLCINTLLSSVTRQRRSNTSID